MTKTTSRKSRAENGFFDQLLCFDENRKLHAKELDLYYIGAFGGKLPEQRRDLLEKLLKTSEKPKS